MQFEEALQFYKQQRRKILAQHFADFIISWDMQTDAAPQSISADAEYGAVLSEYSYELVSDEKFVEAVETLDGNRQLLDDVLCHEVEVMKKNIRQTRSIPKEEYSAYNLLVSQAYPVYVKAKTENDFELFRPYLEKNSGLLSQNDRLACRRRNQRLRRASGHVRTALHHKAIRRIFCFVERKTCTVDKKSVHKSSAGTRLGNATVLQRGAKTFLRVPA